MTDRHVGAVDEAKTMKPDDRVEDDGPEIFLYDGDEDVPQDATHVRVDESLKMVYAQAFFVHSHLRHVDLPEGLKIIRSRAFFMCEALSHVHFPSTLEEIETCAFVGCAKLSQALLPKGIKVLVSAAFAKCESLTHFQVPPLVQVLDVSLFSNCKNLYSVELAPTGITRIGSRAFQNCHQLRNIVLPESINRGGLAFTGCTCLLEALSVSANDDEEDLNLQIFQALKTRIGSSPLHKLCYYQAYYSESSLLGSNANNDSNSLPSFILEGLQELKRLNHCHGGLSKLYQREEYSDMTPLHVLALSSRPNLKLAQAFVSPCRTPLADREHHAAASDQEEETPLPGGISSLAQARDRWNRDPLMYASMNLTPESTAVTMLLLETLLSPLLASLGLPRWRLEVTDEMDRLLYHSTTRSERIQHLQQVLIKLGRYVHMERLSLLELAVWKTSIKAAMFIEEQEDSCIGQDHADNTEMGITIPNEQQQDRAKCRTLCGAQIILSHMLLFLGDP